MTERNVSKGRTYLVQGSREALPALLAHVAREGFPKEGSPDFFLRVYAHFGMDEAQELRARAGLRAVGTDGRVFLIVAPNLTIEAQNALLKTLEEPPGDAVFFFLVPAPEALLPTVRSRAEALALSSSHSRSKHAADFLAASHTQRLDMLKALLPKKGSGEEDGGASERDVAGAVSFLAELERLLAEADIPAVEKARGAEAIYRARRFLTDKGSMMKMLLEQVALLAPVV